VWGVLDAGSQPLAGGRKFEPLSEELLGFLAPGLAIGAYCVDVKYLLNDLCVTVVKLQKKIFQ
jgi:hypothetical protein